MKLTDAVARILQDEGVDTLVCFPRNLLIDPCVQLGMRPIVCRQERVGAGIADGISRSTNGRKIGVFACQGGPGIENTFAGVAQSFSDNIPLLVLPGYHQQLGRSFTRPTFSAVQNFAHITKWACELDDPARVWELFRRGFHNLRTGKGGPVLIEMTREIADADCGEYAYQPVAPVRMAPDPAEVRKAASLLLSAKRPVIHAGQGILFSGATAELVRCAEALDAPVLTTNPGKSAFPENHPLALGAMVISAPKAAFHFLKEADYVFGAGTSLTRTVWGPKIPDGKKIVHLTNAVEDLNREFFTEAALLGDAKLALAALVDEIGSRRRASGNVAAEVASIKNAWREEWAPDLASSETPVNHYRIIADLLSVVDRENTIVTHDAGSPREQLVTFWESTRPRDYLGWGKSTQLGAGLGMIMGAKLMHPEKLCINFMGDASIGMVGMDLETAVRNRIGIMSIVFNNGVMAGELHGLELAAEKFNALDLGGNYCELAKALGVWSARVERSEAFLPAFQEALEVTRSGQSVLIEVMSKKNDRFSRYT